MSLSTLIQKKEEVSICDFYKETNVFITGGTGFVGKVLLEKLLRSCKNIGNVYLLIKSKKDVDPKQRLGTLLECPVFDILRKKTPQKFEKIKVMEGDISQTNLGLNDEDRSILVERVNVVFHLAATVRFKGDFKETIMLNVFGTKEVLQLCEEIHNLKSFIYVSTAFSNADKDYIDELIYNAPFEPAGIIKCVQTLPSHLLEKIIPELIGKLPNAYIFSKALAESLVSEYSGRFPIVVIRPSIVNSSWKEPFPGWVDSIGGATGLIIQCALGIVDYYHVGRNVCAELIPVDIVANTIITAPWHNNITTLSNDSKNDKIPTLKVYNCVSGPINAITWITFCKILLKYIREYPSRYLIRYPQYIIKENKIIYLFHHVFSRYTIGFIYDAFLFCTNRKPRIMSYQEKAAEQLFLTRFATFRERSFCITTFKSLMETVKNANDGCDFDIDMRKSNGFDWDDYLKACSLGIRHYILKDNSTLHDARTKLNRIYWMSKVVQFAFILGVFKIGMSLAEDTWIYVHWKTFLNRFFDLQMHRK